MPQPVVILELASLPNTNVNIEYARQYIQPLDKDSIEMTILRDTAYYHPIAMIHRCEHFIADYIKTQDSLQLKRAQKYVDKLLASAVSRQDGIYLPYPFNYTVHHKNELPLKTPWFSAMAQGEFLSVVTRLFELTRDSTYLSLAHQTFKSLILPRGEDVPWVSRLDSAGFLWLEEYTLPDADQTLNGFIAAVYGVYDYYRVTRSDNAKRMYDICLTTLKNYLPDYCRPGSTSYYCLGHHHIADLEYHRLHISMCRELHRLSGDEFFLQIARRLNSDHPLVDPF